VPPEREPTFAEALLWQASKELWPSLSRIVAISQPGVHHLLVVDAAGQLRGIITPSDLAPRMPEGSVG
jgi:CBS-domain-containing membrane protein